MIYRVIIAINVTRSCLVDELFRSLISTKAHNWYFALLLSYGGHSLADHDTYLAAWASFHHSSVLKALCFNHAKRTLLLRFGYICNFSLALQPLETFPLGRSPPIQQLYVSKGEGQVARFEGYDTLIQGYVESLICNLEILSRLSKGRSQSI
jgi:hypothetical protein